MATKPRLVQSASNLPTRSSRVKTAFRTDKAKVEKLSANVFVSSPDQVVNIECFVVKIADDHVVLRQKMKAGSSKQVLKTYPMSKVVSLTVTEGSTGIVQVKSDSVVLTLKDQSVSYEGQWIVATDNKTGEVTRLNTINCSVETVIEEVPAVSASRTAPAKAPAKAPVKTGGRLRSVRSSDDDEMM